MRIMRMPSRVLAPSSFLLLVAFVFEGDWWPFRNTKSQAGLQAIPPSVRRLDGLVWASRNGN